MNDIPAKDPFATLMSRRVKVVELEGLPPIEVREAPIKDVKPIMDMISELPPAEITFRLMGISIFVDGQQLTYERLMNMSASAVEHLMPLAPYIYEVYGLQTDEKEASSNQKKESSTQSSEDSSSSPSSSTKPSESSKKR